MELRIIFFDNLLIYNYLTRLEKRRYLHWETPESIFHFKLKINSTMETKKTNRASLENKRTMFFELGLIASLAIVLASFEWNSTTKDVAKMMAGTVYLVEDESVPVTQQETPPPPETIQEPVMSEDLQIVENDVKIDTDFISPDDNPAPMKIVPYIEHRNIEEDVEEDTEIPFAIVEEKPLFMGKEADEFTKWVYNNIHYPELAIENGIQGRITLQFTIDKDGNVCDIKVLRGADSSLDKEAVRVIGSSPKWSPGRQRGRKVSVKYTFPIVFRLN